MNKYILEFEKPLKDLEDKIESLRKTAINTGVDVSDGIISLQDELKQQQKNQNFFRCRNHFSWCFNGSIF